MWREDVYGSVLDAVASWEDRLLRIPAESAAGRRNGQGRSIKEILGHLIDSAGNNTHRIIHLQYRESPVDFPNYASNGNNDRWIAIQAYQGEDWPTLIRLWKYANLHLAHVIRSANAEKADSLWMAGPGQTVSLREMALDYPAHMVWHLEEIEALSGSAS